MVHSFFEVDHVFSRHINDIIIKNMMTTTDEDYRTQDSVFLEIVKNTNEIITPIESDKVK